MLVVLNRSHSRDGSRYHQSTKKKLLIDLDLFWMAASCAITVRRQERHRTFATNQLNKGIYFEPFNSVLSVYLSRIRMKCCRMLNLSDTQIPIIIRWFTFIYKHLILCIWSIFLSPVKCCMHICPTIVFIGNIYVCFFLLRSRGNQMW